MTETATVQVKPTPTEMTFEREVVDGGRTYQITATAMADGRTALCIRSGASDAFELNELSGVIAKEDLPLIALAFKAELAGIAAWHGISVDERTRSLALLRVKHPNAYLAWSEEEEERMLKLRRDGHSISAISKELGRQPGAVSRRLERHGIFT